MDFLQNLTDRCVELLGADASGLMLSDQRGGLKLVAATMERARLLELFELQVQEGPSVCRGARGAGHRPEPAPLEGVDDKPTFDPFPGTVRRR